MFATYYAAAWATGMRFDTQHLDEGWQILPRDVLVDDPIGSVWYLHVQPPLWNLSLGALLRTSPLPDALTLQVLLLAVALALVWMAAEIVWRTTSIAWLAVGVPLYAVLHPDVLANALEPRYELPVAALVVAMAWAAVRFRDRHVTLAVLLAVLATTTVLTRALYHPLWLVAVLALVVWVARPAGRRALTAITATSLVVVGAVMLKNLVVFGTFTLSSWTGMNLLRSIEPVVPQDEVDAAFERDDVSGVALVGPFQDLAAYEPHVDPCTPDHDHRAVTVEIRTDGLLIPVANFNHECYLPIYEQAGADARRLIRDHPDDWVQGRVESVEAFASRSSDLTDGGSVVVRATAQLYRVLDVQLPITLTVRLLTSDGTTIETPSNVTTIATSCVAAVALAAAWLARRRNRAQVAAPGAVLALVLVGFTAAWTFVTGVVGELGEQARFRTMVQPAAVVLTAVLVALALRSRRHPEVSTADLSARDERRLVLGQTERGEDE